MGVNIHQGTLGTIPYLAYEGPQAKRLIFLQHGIYGNKEKVMNLMGVAIANLGYVVVGLDTVGHGERGEAPFLNGHSPHGELRMFDLIEPTAEDVLAIYESVYQTRFSEFDYIGISLGGLIGYHLASQTKRLNRLYILMSTPNYEAFYQHLNPTLSARYQTLIEAGKAKVKKLNPSLKPDALAMKSLHVYHGLNDQEIPLSATTEWLETASLKDVTVETFETGHKINKPMFEALLKRLKITEG